MQVFNLIGDSGCVFAGGAGIMRCEGGGPVVRVQRSRECRAGRGAVEIMPNIFLTAPDHLHRGRGGGLGEKNRLFDEIIIIGQFAAEAAADRAIMQGDAVARQPGGFGGGGARLQRILHAGPDFAKSVGDAHRRVRRLHGGVRQIRHAVGRVDGNARLAPRRFWHRPCGYRCCRRLRPEALAGAPRSATTKRYDSPPSSQTGCKARTACKARQ